MRLGSVGEAMSHSNVSSSANSRRNAKVRCYVVVVFVLYGRFNYQYTKLTKPDDYNFVRQELFV